MSDPRELFLNWPRHEVSDLMKFYYMSQLGCYLHQLIWTEVSRSDSTEMIAHHLITMGLLVVSYIARFTRYGSLILLLHDFSDIFLEIGKCINYTSEAPGRAHLSKICDLMFGIFTISFFITRLLLYPKIIIVSLWVHGYDHFGSRWWFAWVITGFLVALQFLHVFWFYLISRMVVRLFIVGKVEGDVRSDDEDDDEFTKNAKKLATKKSKKN